MNSHHFVFYITINDLSKYRQSFIRTLDLLYFINCQRNK